MARQSNNLFHRATGSGAVDVTVSPVNNTGVAVNFVLSCVKFHMGATGGAVEDFTAIADSATTSAYDVKLLTQNMYTTQDILWIPERSISFNAGDILKFDYTNTNGRTWGLEVVYRRAI